MSSPKVGSNRGAIQVAFSLAALLEHIERSPGPINAHQYQKVVRGLKDALSGPIPDSALAELLRRYPSAVAVHEELHYQTHGLSCTLSQSHVSSEVLALQAVQRAASVRR